MVVRACRLLPACLCYSVYDYEIPYPISNEVTELQHRYTSVKQRLDEATSEKDHLQTAVHRLTGEKKQLNVTVEEYRTESESLLNEYTQAVSELRQTNDEKNKLQQMFTKCDQDLHQQRERCKQLETLQMDLQSRIAYMDEQV